MALVAQFEIIIDGEVSLPQNGSYRFESTFELGNADSSSRAMLVFGLSINGQARLRVYLNQTLLMNQHFTVPPPSPQYIGVPRNCLRETNVLVVDMGDEADHTGATVELNDMVLGYRAIPS